MAISFNIPQSPRTYIYSMTDFLGVDYNDPLDMSMKHSPKMYNMLSKNGYLKKRYGLKIKLHITNDPIYGIWQYDVPSDSNFSEILIVHCGNKLYEVASDFSSYTQVMSNLAENDSYGMFLGDKLVILDGYRAIIYGKYNNVYGPKYMDSVAYIPTSTIGLTPNGMNGTSYESVNLLTQFRINEFIGDGNSKEFHTDSYSISAQSVDTKVWILNNETGEWNLVPSTDYTVDTNNKITFNVAPPAPIVTGRDNVRIQFKSTTSDQANLINKCRFCVPFGYQGNNQRLFFSGNPDQPNVDWHSELVAAQPDPTYVPDDSFAVIGSMPIKGYLRLSDGTLAILKGLSDTDCSIYYRTSNTYSNSKGVYDVFPLLTGTKNVGCLSNYTCCNVENHPMFLGELGVFEAITTNASTTLERYADNKSYYINKELLKFENLKNAKAISIGSDYYLFLGNKWYVCDTSRYTLPSNMNIYQYEWYPMQSNINTRSVMRWNNQLVIGDNSGNILMFGDDYIDEIDSDTKENVKCYFETFPIDFTTSDYNRATKSKTTRNFTLNYIAPENTKFTFGYKTIDDNVDSETIYKIIDGNLPTNTSDNVNYPYGTKVNTNNNDIYGADSNGIFAWLYGTQTELVKTLFGFYKTDEELILGVFTIDYSNRENPKVTILKKLYSSIDGHLNNSFILKKLLHNSVSDASAATGLNIINITPSRNLLTISNPTENEIPQTITLKEKARKIMFMKFFVESEELACEFDRVFIEYRVAGKYRGE